MASEARESTPIQYHLQEGELHFYIRQVISETEKDFWSYISSQHNKGKSLVGVGHFQTALSNYQDKGTDVWVGFVSDSTVPDRGLINPSAFSTYEQYVLQENIEMMVSVTTSASAPFSTHRGIMRTDYTYKGEKHPHISEQLHSFASKGIAEHYPGVKPYMLFVPTPIMRDILHKSLTEAGMLDRFHLCSKESGEWRGSPHNKATYTKATLEEATAHYNALPKTSQITGWDYETIFKYHMKRQEADIASGDKKTPPFEVRINTTEVVCTDEDGEYTKQVTTTSLKHWDTDRKKFKVLVQDDVGFLVNDPCFIMQPLCAVEQGALSDLAELSGEIDCLSLEA